MSYADIPEGFILVEELCPASALCHAILSIPDPKLRAELLFRSQQFQNAMAARIIKADRARQAVEKERNELLARQHMQYALVWHN